MREAGRVSACAEPSGAAAIVWAKVAVVVVGAVFNSGHRRRKWSHKHVLILVLNGRL